MSNEFRVKPIGVPRKELRTMLMNNKTIMYHLADIKPMARNIKMAAIVASGTIAAFVGLDEISPFFQHVPDLGNAVMTGLFPGIGLGGLFFGVKTLLHGQKASLSIFVKAIKHDANEGFNAILMGLSGLAKPEDKKLFMGEIAALESADKLPLGFKAKVGETEIARNTQVSGLNAEIAKLHEKANTVQAKITQLESEYNTKMRKFKKEEDDMVAMIESKKTLLKQIVDKIVEKGLEVEKLDERITSSKNILIEETHKYEDWKKGKDEQSARLKEVHAQEVAGLQQEIGGLTTQRDKLVNEIDTVLSPKKDELNVQIKQFTEKRDEVIVSLAKLNETFEREKAKQKKNLEDLKRQSLAVLHDIDVDLDDLKTSKKKKGNGKGQLQGGAQS